MRDTNQQRAIRNQVNARLRTIELDLAALLRFCTPAELSSARRLLARATKVVHDARIPPGQVASWAAHAEVSKASKRRQAPLFADEVASGPGKQKLKASAPADGPR